MGERAQREVVTFGWKRPLVKQLKIERQRLGRRWSRRSPNAGALTRRLWISRRVWTAARFPPPW